MSLTLTNIPGIMRHHGWNKAATLMDRWFAGPAIETPRYNTPDQTTITMNWALDFDRARGTYNRLIQNRIWANPAAQNEIASMLRRKNLLQSATVRFGNFAGSVATLDADYINQRSMSGGSGARSGQYIGAYFGAHYSGYYPGYSGYYPGGGMDDMLAALGNFNFRVLVAGEVTPASGGGYDVTIQEIGVYLRDSYSFEGDQPLGFWDDSDNSVSAINFFSGTYVSNASFRDWRAANARGGDFLIYSDLRRTVLARPDVFHIA
ncbi:MAG: DUF6402 family protein [Planctomycetota bacterium]